MAWKYMGALRLFLILISCQTRSIQSALLSSYLLSSFTPPDYDSTLPFNHIAINNITGDVYIGARERLYQLDSGLTLKHTVNTGWCTYPNEGSVNDNKLLIVVTTPQKNTLITCGGCDGFCETRSLANISHDIVRYGLDDWQLVVTTKDLPTVGAVVLGAEYVRSGEGTPNRAFYLFTGVSDGIPFISKHNILDLSLDQNIPRGYVKSESLFKYLVVYKDYLYYFISRGNSVYLGRLCRNSLDQYFESYTEIELQCGSYNMIQSAHIGPAGSQLAVSLNIDDTDVLLYAVFSNEISSALCVYKMSDVQQSFDVAVLGCIQGTGDGTTNEYFAIHSSVCENFPSTTPGTFQCTAYIEYINWARFVYRYVSGTVPLSASPIITIPDVISTSIVTTIERHHTVAFMGDTQGKLHKLNIVNGSSGYVYEDVFLGDGSVLQELFLDESKEQLTLATSSEQGSKVLTLELVNCSQYQSCEECIGEDGGNDGDPYCGWCTLEARCTRNEECPFSDESARWLSYNAFQCATISDVKPDHRLPYQETEQEITITVQQLPILKENHQYRCAFDPYQVNAVTKANTVMCVSPPASELPTIPEEADHVTLTLSIVSTETGVSLVSTDFISFDCTHLKSCSSCVTSPWPCDWCVYDNMCTHDSSSCQPGETVVIGENNVVGSGNKGQSYCPQLIGIAESIFIPVNILSGYSLLASNLPTEQTKIQSFDCIVRVDGVGIRVPSSAFNESYILCSAAEYIYNENIIEKNVSVSVQWNGQYNIDDPTDTYVTLYKCSVNSGSCSRCLSKEATPSNLNCGWCGNDCNVIRNDVCQNNQFLSQNETQLCSAPVITDFYPSSGPINAQTKLQITGTDLGVEFGDVLEIVIGDLVCILSDMGSFYQPGQSVSCMTGISTELISGHIGITVRSGGSTKNGRSTAEFLYRDPIISGFSPTEGQVAGGTEITITGMYLNTGRNIEASFGEAQCNNLIVDDSTATCITSSLQMNEQVSVFLTMTYDGVEKTSEDTTFTYYPNAIIDGIDRTVSIMSGGLDIKLTGQRFDVIQEPRIIVSSLITTDASNSKLCNGTETILICPIPSFPDNGIFTRRRRATNGVMTANLIFDFDGYIVDGGLIEYYPDPMYESFIGPNRIYESGNSRLEIAGINLNLASTEDDVQVLLGPNGVCDVDDLEIDIVRCQLPEKQPLPGYTNGTLGQGPAKNLPAVTVLHGNLRFSPGFVSARATEGNPLIAIVIPVVIVVPILIIIPMIILVWWFRKKQLEVKRAREEVKMIRMNILKRVREVSNISLDLSEADYRVQKQGVPFVGHVQYVTTMLFAGLGIQPETTEPEYMEDFMEHSLISFYRMLNEKAGMIELIRQLENKKAGRGRERELIASLLAITFVSEGKSIHFTDVLTSLVEDEIVTASTSRRRMDTLFTNTESVAEKLINNWFALFMFEYLKVYGVYPLYMLYQAVKTQAEKGPIDVVTEDAYYTLEFSKLLYQEIDFHSLGIDVVDEDGHVYLHVTVLDVDTVKQAKQKILDSLWKKSYCLLPRDIDAVDLVWIQTTEMITLLQEIDKSSETRGKTMINTMKSFGIRNGSNVALIPKNHGDEYQTLDLKEVSSRTYESLQHVTVEMIPESQPSQPALNAIHLKGGVEELTREKSNLPDYMTQMKANLDRNLAIPHMLTMKASISPYVDGIFEVMFKKPANIPLPVKHLFDTFDELAMKYAGGGLPEDCADKWKKNCLSNFWSSVLTNLPSMFEMPRSETADRCAIALAGALNDAATTKTLRQAESDHLPYYNEHPLQRKMMTDYCTQVTSQPKVRPGKLNKACSSISMEFKGEFSHLSNLLHLYNLTKNDMEGLLK